MTKRSPAEAGHEGVWAQKGAKWLLALSRMEEALHLLDESEAPAHVGAQLDLAIQQLKGEIARSRDEGRVIPWPPSRA